MATGALTRIRNNDAYIGLGKQAAWGTGVTPTLFPLWLDGSEWGEDFKTQSERQGDALPWTAFTYKTAQYPMVKIVHYARPILLGAILQAFMGLGSDTYTAPTKSGTLSAAIVAGASSFSTATDLGLTGTLALNFTPGTSAVYETQTVDCTTKTGVGPFTYSLAAGAKFLYAHASADPISSAANHSFTRQLGAYSPYTLEYGWGQKGNALGDGSPAQQWQMINACCTDVRINGQVGQPFKVESTWVGTNVVELATAATPTYEGRNVVGQAGSPFMYYQGGTSWTLDGSSSGNAAIVRSASLQMKNTTDVSEFLAEQITPSYFSMGNIDATLGLDVVFQSFAQMNEMYYGQQTITTGAGDSYFVGYGSFVATWLADALNSFGINAARGAYTAPAKLTPKLDGKSQTQTLQLAMETSNATTNPLTLTLANSQASAY